MSAELPEATELQVISLQPGDLLVARCTERLTLEHASKLKAALTAKVPAGVQILIVDSAWSLEAYRPLEGARHA